MSVWDKINNWTPEATTMMRFHFWLTVIWGFLIFPSVLWWKESVPWLVLMSAWANFVGHFSAWQATRSEYKQDEAAA